MAYLDKKTREGIISTVKSAAKEYYEVANEVWLSGEQLAEQFPFFTIGWQKRYAHMLPRERITICGKDGNCHSTSWCYPKHQIQRMIHEGAFRYIKKVEKNEVQDTEMGNIK